MTLFLDLGSEKDNRFRDRQDQCAANGVLYRMEEPFQVMTAEESLCNITRSTFRSPKSASYHGMQAATPIQSGSLTCREPSSAILPLSVNSEAFLGQNII
jgi:hypothetical protein